MYGWYRSDVWFLEVLGKVGCVAVVLKGLFVLQSFTRTNFAKHLQENAHPFDTIQKTMQILEYHKKGAHLNTLERFHIHTEHKANNHLNDKHTVFPNAIFDTLLKNHQP
jgi:hypothetical protein